MNLKQLQDIRRDYNSYMGTGNNKSNKMGVAVEEFESVLNAAIQLASDNKELQEELNNRPKGHEPSTLTKQQEREDSFLYDDEEPCDMKQAADFARYG